MATNQSGTTRRATTDDAAAIARVHVATWRTAYRGIVPDEHLSALSEEAWCADWRATLETADGLSFAFVAEHAGQVIGFADGGPERTGDSRFPGELYGLYVLAEHQRQGIGRALFREVVDALLARRMDSMKLWTLKDSPHRAFYDALGGVIVGETWIKIGGADLLKVAYGWEGLGQWRLGRGFD